VTVNAPTPPPPPPYAPPPVPPVVDLTAPVAPPVEPWAEVPPPPPVAPPPVAPAPAEPWTGVDPGIAPPPAAPAGAPVTDPSAPSLWAEPAAVTEAPEERARVGGIRDDQLPGRLDVHQLSQWFNKRKVLERCSLSMEPGEVTALIGPSGCGKSTFLRALNRMHELVPGAELSGQVLLNGVDIYGVDMSPTEVRLRIGMVFQKPNPFPAMSIADNVLAGLGLSGSRTDDPEGLVEQCLRRAGLWAEVKDRLNESGMSLSGGQQQRLCIARSLAVHPDVLLMDEPCSALDPISTRVIEETIRELCHDITIVIVTHNMQQAQRVSDQCAFFLVETLGEPGRIVEHGPTERMFDNPSDPRTLDYVNGRFG
jgi:phosphate transport system ATP-binding protein